jgi:hypothetical protein
MDLAAAGWRRLAVPNLTDEGRGEKQEQEVGDAPGDGDRALAGSAVQACYQACYDYYAPAPNNAQFYFQLVPDGSGGEQCQCCKTCTQVVTEPGAVLMAACAPSTALRLSPSLSRKVVKVQVSGTKAVNLRYTLRLKGTSKSLRLSDMGVRLTLPTNAAAIKLPHQATAAGNTVTWYPFNVAGAKTRALRVGLTLSPPFGAGGASELRFQTDVFQNAACLAAAPYCVLPAPDVAMAIKYP